MATTADLRDQCRALATRVERPPVYGDLRSAYLDLAPLIGAIQGAVGQAIREQGDTSGTAEARHALDALRDAARQVGFDLRLASPAALQAGLRTALAQAKLALDALDYRCPPTDSRGSSSPV